jgi:hypothetical protein
MSTFNPQGPLIRIKPQDNVYTVLLAVAILFLALAAGIVLHSLMVNYGMSFGDIFKPGEIK